MDWGKSMFDELANCKVLVTGATGLIGQAIVKRLIACKAKVLCVVRSLEKAKSILGIDTSVSFIVSDVTELQVTQYGVDYIIHCASNTSSKAFIDDPVGVINTAFEGTKRTLDIARLNNVKGYVYLSSMEVYGAPLTDEKVDELHSSNLNTMVPRSAYPESKRLCESLCASYASQYGIAANVIRLTQTFGPGVQYNDGRVFAEFARCVIEGRNIVLHTKGDTKRSYLYTEDAVDAILTVLVSKVYGEAYNAANEDTYCSILEMAELVAKECANGKIKVVIDEVDTKAFGYASTLHMNLDTSKLKKLGWKPTTSLVDMYRKMIADMKLKRLS